MSLTILVDNADKEENVTHKVPIHNVGSRVS